MIRAVNFDLQRWDWPIKDFQDGNIMRESTHIPEILHMYSEGLSVGAKGYQNLLFIMLYLAIFR